MCVYVCVCVCVLGRCVLAITPCDWMPRTADAAMPMPRKGSSPLMYWSVCVVCVWCVRERDRER